MQLANTESGLFLSKAWQKLRVPVISLFILYHTLALVLWTCPPFPLYSNMVPLIRPYVCYLGFWNQWKMFSHPKHWNLYLTANVTMADGRIVEWDFPRMEKLDYLTRVQKERYRKWADEYINEEDYKFACPDACRFIAGQLRNATTEPVAVQLVRHWSWIQPPKGLGKPLPKGEFDYTFFTYDLKPEDFK